MSKPVLLLRPDGCSNDSYSGACCEGSGSKRKRSSGSATHSMTPHLNTLLQDSHPGVKITKVCRGGLKPVMPGYKACPGDS